ncbi:hypothetical protein KUCAC02_023759, partial [Chaenocephalus aceratus]
PEEGAAENVVLFPPQENQNDSRQGVTAGPTLGLIPSIHLQRHCHSPEAKSLTKRDDKGLLTVSSSSQQSLLIPTRRPSDSGVEESRSQLEIRTSWSSSRPCWPSLDFSSELNIGESSLGAQTSSAEGKCEQVNPLLAGLQQHHKVSPPRMVLDKRPHDSDPVLTDVQPSPRPSATPRPDVRPLTPLLSVLLDRELQEAFQECEEQMASLSTLSPSGPPGTKPATVHNEGKKTGEVMVKKSNESSSLPPLVVQPGHSNGGHGNKNGEEKGLPDSLAFICSQGKGSLAFSAKQGQAVSEESCSSKMPHNSAEAETKGQREAAVRSADISPAEEGDIEKEHHHLEAFVITSPLRILSGPDSRELCRGVSSSSEAEACPLTNVAESQLKSRGWREPIASISEGVFTEQDRLPSPAHQQQDEAERNCSQFFLSSISPQPLTTKHQITAERQASNDQQVQPESSTEKTFQAQTANNINAMSGVGVSLCEGNKGNNRVRFADTVKQEGSSSVNLRSMALSPMDCASLPPLTVHESLYHRVVEASYIFPEFLVLKKQDIPTDATPAKDDLAKVSPSDFPKPQKDVRSDKGQIKINKETINSNFESNATDSKSEACSKQPLCPTEKNGDLSRAAENAFPEAGHHKSELVSANVTKQLEAETREGALNLCLSAEEETDKLHAESKNSVTTHESPLISDEGNQHALISCSAPPADDVTSELLVGQLSADPDPFLHTQPSDLSYQPPIQLDRTPPRGLLTTDPIEATEGSIIPSAVQTKNESAASVVTASDQSIPVIEQCVGNSFVLRPRGPLLSHMELISDCHISLPEQTDNSGAYGDSAKVSREEDGRVITKLSVAKDLEHNDVGVKVDEPPGAVGVLAEDGPDNVVSQSHIKPVICEASIKDDFIYVSSDLPTNKACDQIKQEDMNEKMGDQTSVLPVGSSEDRLSAEVEFRSEPQTVYEQSLLQTPTLEHSSDRDKAPDQSQSTLEPNSFAQQQQRLLGSRRPTEDLSGGCLKGGEQTNSKARQTLAMAPGVREGAEGGHGSVMSLCQSGRGDELTDDDGSGNERGIGLEKGKGEGAVEVDSVYVPSHPASDVNESGKAAQRNALTDTTALSHIGETRQGMDENKSPALEVDGSGADTEVVRDLYGEESVGNDFCPVLAVQIHSSETEECEIQDDACKPLELQSSITTSAIQSSSVVHTGPDVEEITKEDKAALDEEKVNSQGKGQSEIKEAVKEQESPEASTVTQSEEPRDQVSKPGDHTAVNPVVAAAHCEGETLVAHVCSSAEAAEVSERQPETNWIQALKEAASHAQSKQETLRPFPSRESPQLEFLTPAEEIAAAPKEDQIPPPAQAVEKTTEIPPLNLEKKPVDLPEPFKKPVDLPEPLKKPVDLPEPFKKPVDLPEPFKKPVDLPETLKKPVDFPEPLKKPVDLPEPFKKPVDLPEPLKKPVDLPEPLKKPVDLPAPLKKPVDLPEPFKKPVDLPAPFKKPVDLPEPLKKPVDLPEPFKKPVDLPEPFKKPVDLPEPFKKPVDLPEPLKKPVDLPEPLKKPVDLPEPLKKPVDLPEPLKKPVDLPEPLNKPVELPEPLKKPVDLPEPLKKPVDLPEPLNKPVELPEPIQGTKVKLQQEAKKVELSEETRKVEERGK